MSDQETYDLTEHLPEGHVPLGYVAVLKSLDTDGSVSMRTVWAQDLSPWEIIGMLVSAQDDHRDMLRSYGTVSMDVDSEDDD